MASTRAICRRIFTVNSPIIKPLAAVNYSYLQKRQVNTHENPKIDLWEAYHNAKQIVEGQPLPREKDPHAVYANNELDLGAIDVYGFDYDYTLACYTSRLHHIIYEMGRDILVNEHKYPKDLSLKAFDPDFSVRGLHCDVQKGLLLKIDAFHHIQMGTVYRGKSPVSDEEVMRLYDGSHVCIENMSSFYGTGKSMHQLMDLFALPEMNLFADVTQYFISEGIDYDPEYVFYDVRNAVQGIHANGSLHKCIMENLDSCIGQRKEIAELLQRLTAAGKQLFLITNSGINFVDRGMSYLCGSDWQKLFDVIITNARKPKFFHDTTRPFRSYNRALGVKTWNTVTDLKKGQVYMEGNFEHLSKMTGWYGSRVLYFGDHVYTDLADVTLKHGWRTGAIIPELEHEIKIINNGMFQRSVRWLTTLERLLQKMQKTIHRHETSQNDPESLKIIEQWMDERNELRLVTKSMFNPRFGSLFRTYHNPTYFTRRLNRFADVYTSSVTNMLNYSLNHTYYPRRVALPHELDATSVLDTAGATSILDAASTIS